MGTLGIGIPISYLNVNANKFEDDVDEISESSKESKQQISANNSSL